VKILLRKRSIIALSIFLLAIGILSSVCVATWHTSSPSVKSQTQARLKVLATSYPVYDFTHNVGGERIQLSLLVSMAVDVHDFEPTPNAIAEVASADVLIFNGAGLEPWIPQILAAANNPRLVVIDSSMGIQPLRVPPAFQKDNRTVDPHIWLDPVLAMAQVLNILRGLVQADPADRDYFVANANNYNTALDELHQAIINVTSHVKTRYFVTFHEAFTYFAKRYNLTQISIAGPFEEEPTPSGVQHVVTAIRDQHLCYVGYESLENPAVSQSIASQTKATLVQMDPIEDLSQQDQMAGKSYLDKMYDNLQVFTMVLNNVGC
jgi:zinc transport system substrate-binding protein